MMPPRTSRLPWGTGASRTGVCATGWWAAPNGSSSREKCLPGLCWGGFGNIEDNLLHLPEGSYRAIALRSFDPRSRQWAIWWLDARAPHQLDVPVVGSFENGVGTFYAEDRLNGTPIWIRFTWLTSNPDHPRWQQAFSADGGTTWEPNWTMDFRRAVAQPSG